MRDLLNLFINFFYDLFYIKILYIFDDFNLMTHSIFIFKLSLLIGTHLLTWPVLGGVVFGVLGLTGKDTVVFLKNKDH